MTRLSGKIAIVTGSGGGIGRAIAERFAVEGAHVWVTDINGETAEEAVRHIKSKGGAATAMLVDVSKGQDTTALLRNVEKAHGYADILVNNAGILVRGEIRQLSDSDWAKLREVNLDAILRLSRDGLPLLRKSKAPSIINISSIMANRGLRPLAAYTATKGAITALTKGLAVEYAPFNVRVNSVAPGYVETGITDRLLKLPPVKKALIDKTPMGRLGRPEDMTGAAVFFASDDSLYCTGSELAVDGGMSAGL
ncbi:SDR family NAD(P)-dependent oxidoreductase [Hyphomicrobium facile]|uniref:NAD(P)-dependent dehydrogenase, short-chain alcohol dehydrogenase family n=1 Tax=Hyphomicrobium facile TaxID=51670 RepID=A0A1I7NWY7_9HYPH|nr:glucose 1-dehydrogenase [Hyphomicrobium facile]SFV39114.1 NAD(P)-dependent dehydrogenase, short-chain alcohol dehydrogenase family [Hyphomicrobium facile]